MDPIPLPIDTLLPDIKKTLEAEPACIVTAEPGAGKTTRVPPTLLSAAFAKGKEIWVLQPRRLAAKTAALRVAEEMGEPVGGTVGYQFRFEKNISARTKLKFMTDGMLLPLAQDDPSLKNVAAVVLDEFHERSLALELGLAWLRHLQQTTRPDLRLLVMSATLDAQALSDYFEGCPVLKSTGRVFPVDIQYLPFPEQPDLAFRVRSAVRQWVSATGSGTLLCFLPGLFEIRQAQKALASEPLEVQTLYGDMEVEEQQKVLRPASGRKIILSTNVAETSLTVPDVTAVVDSGLTRQARVSPWSGLSSLVTVPASQASAAQRAGRAGRLQEGICYRLYSKYDFDHRPAFDIPELLRSDLSQSLLDLLDLGIEDLRNFPWFLKPSDPALGSASSLLQRLGAIDPQGHLTEIGKRMARMPLAPRLSRFLLQMEGFGENSKGLEEAARLAVLINEEKAGSEDLLEELKRYEPGFNPKKLVEQALRNLKPRAEHTKPSSDRLAQGLLAAFPDRIAKIRTSKGSEARDRSGQKRELLLSGGGTAFARDNALTRSHDYFVVVEAQETDKGILVRSLCPIEPDWLLDLPDLKDEKTFTWNDKTKKVEGFERLRYGQLTLDEKAIAPADFGPEAADILLKEALSLGATAYCDPEELAVLLSRMKFVAQRSPSFPGITDDSQKETLSALCQGCRSFEELKARGFITALKARLSPKDQALLEKLAPSSVLLSSGRRLPIHYEEGKPPWVESRIQDFFGMEKGPTVAGGEVPVVLHLLSPAKRPVQVTSDLAGFWKNHYPQVRKELMRRYPRHQWPENPI